MNQDKGQLIAGILVIAFWLTTGISWIVNLVKLIGSLGAHDIWGAVVHGIGLLGPAAIITVWF